MPTAWGVKTNLKEAVAWVGKAAGNGLPAAQFVLATLFAAGTAVPRDDQIAHAWFTKAAEQGHLKAMYRLAKMHETAQPRVAYAQLC